MPGNNPMATIVISGCSYKSKTQVGILLVLESAQSQLNRVIV